MFGFASKPLRRLDSRKGIIWIPLPLAWIPLPRAWIPFPRALIGFRRAWIGVGVTATAPSMPNCSQPPPRRPFGRPTRRPLRGFVFRAFIPVKGALRAPTGRRLGRFPCKRRTARNSGHSRGQRRATPAAPKLRGSPVRRSSPGKLTAIESLCRAPDATPPYVAPSTRKSQRSASGNGRLRLREILWQQSERRKSAGAPLRLKPRSARRAGQRRRPSPSPLSDRFRRARCGPWPRPRHP